MTTYSDWKATGYFFQSVLIGSWWLGIYLSGSFYTAFEYTGFAKEYFLSFFIPDLMLVIAPSFLRAYKRFKQLEYIILGAIGFGAMYCLSLSLATQSGILSTSIMLLAFGYNLFLTFGDQLFRNSTDQSLGLIAFKTLIQIICFWVITLALIPSMIEISFNNHLSFAPKYQFSLGVLLFAVFGSFGLISSYYMVVKGNGTPIPLDQTNKLVIVGPYKFVRNPMAIAGLGQGIAVGIILSSLHVLFYVLIGGLIWNYVVRPSEERNLESRFGSDYLDYKKKTKCWIPKFS